MTTTARRATIEPTWEHTRIAEAAVALVVDLPAELSDAVAPDFASLLSDEGLAERIAEQTKRATVALVHAAHCAKLLADRRASRELTREQKDYAHKLAEEFDTVRVERREHGLAVMHGYDETPGLPQRLCLVQPDGQALTAVATDEGHVVFCSDWARAPEFVACGALKRDGGWIVVAQQREGRDDV